ncbi:MAG: hypothetical protein RR320_02825 [Oscillospiraceae bacterium]
MDDLRAWEIFSRTGRISDYLAYAAQTRRQDGLPGTQETAHHAGFNDGDHYSTEVGRG